MKKNLTDQLLINCLNTHYGMDIAALTFLPLGADMDATLYKAQAHDGTSYFVKLKWGHRQDIGVEIVELLHEAGIQEIIPPVKTHQGRFTQPLEDCTLIVYPFVEGQDGFSRDLTDKQWIKLGQALRQIHDIDVPPSIQKQIRREAYSPKWREAVRSLLAHIESKPMGDDIALNLLKFMQENMPAIHRLVDRAEQLGQKIQSRSPKFVLCHSDIHGGNVLMDGNDAIYIVDWDHPIMAPKERDLMFIGGGVANVWNKQHEEELFYKGYGKTEVNKDILAYYRHERIVEDIAVYGQALLLTTAEGKGRSEMYRQFIAMFDPRGVVELAFKTDDGLDT